MSRRPFVVVGESLVDIVVTPDGTESHAVGGSPMNVAVGLARLDVPSLLVTQIGDDASGRAVAQHVRASGVDLLPSSVRAGCRTSTATARLDHAHAAAYDFDLTWDLPQQRLPHAAGLHVGSLGTFLAPGRAAVLDLVRQADEAELFISYDPNVRPAFLTDPAQAWREVMVVAASSRLVKLSDEDAHLLRPADPLEAVASDLLTGEATELVIVTRGGDGAAAFGEGYSVTEAAPPVDVVDTVGAGDSFMAATLAILDDWDLLEPGRGRLAAIGERRVRTLLGGAMAAAGVTCSRRGANPPTRRELRPTWPAS
jgi:fructokinase